jgi:enoyl-CoA hydratase/carnithine racemase
MNGEILVTREADVATVTLSNPPKLNALTVAMWRELAAAMHRLSDDDTLRCVVLRGAGS